MEWNIIASIWKVWNICKDYSTDFKDTRRHKGSLWCHPTVTSPKHGKKNYARALLHDFFAVCCKIPRNILIWGSYDNARDGQFFKVLLFFGHNWLKTKLSAWFKSTNILYKPKRKYQLSFASKSHPHQRFGNVWSTPRPNVKRPFFQTSIDILFHPRHSELEITELNKMFWHNPL